jgi:hypothetical protein
MTVTKWLKLPRHTSTLHFSDMPRQPDDVRSLGAKQTSRRKVATSVFGPISDIRLRGPMPPRRLRGICHRTLDPSAIYRKWALASPA